MFVKVLTGAILTLGLGAFGALAQSTADVGGPRELPPASFTGQQYVDSRGCVFLRAGLGGRVNWVPRVDRNRRAMCGYPPSMGGGTRQVAAAPEPAPEPAPAPVVRQQAPQVRVTAAEPPAASYVPAPVRVARPAAPVLVPMPAPVVAAAPAPQGGGMRVGCTTAAPVAQRLRLTNGGSVIVCTRGDGTLEGLRAPIFPEGSPVGASLESPSARVVPLGQPSGIGNGSTGARVVDHVTAVPKGYKLVWEDDRLNPLRGVGTAEGQAAQDQVWTRKIPAQAVEDAPRRVVISAQNAPAPQVVQPRVTQSTKSVPAAATGGRLFVQVGSFGVAANADGASARLAGLGLPVARSNGRIGGKAVQVVLAGPFGSAAEAQAALRAARGAGFGDAFVR